MDKPIMKLLALFTLVFAISCGTVTTASPSVSPSAAPPASVSPSANASALPGSTFSMPVDREMLYFFVDRGALIARSTRESSAPYESKIWRAEPSSATWRPVYVSDSMFQFEKVADGRMAIVEYREPVQGGGAFSQVVVVTDLVTGAKIEMDRFSLSPATYRGGGGAPRRPVTAVALDSDRVAWTRLVEGPAGAVIGELRLAPIADPRAQQVIGSSSEWIQPIGLDSRRLVYILGGKTEDQLRMRDIGSGVDTVVATAPVRDTAFFGPPGIDRAAVSGDWAIWIDEARVAGDIAQTVAVNLATGERRTLDTRGSGCSTVTGGVRYFAWSCAKSNGTAEPFVVLDAKTLSPIALTRQGLSYGLGAAEDAVIWLNAVNGGESRTVTLYRP
jgi:hypothetical protein